MTVTVADRKRVAAVFLIGQGASEDLASWTVEQPDCDLEGLARAGGWLSEGEVMAENMRAAMAPVVQRPPKATQANGSSREPRRARRRPHTRPSPIERAASATHLVGCSCDWCEYSRKEPLAEDIVARLELLVDAYDQTDDPEAKEQIRQAALREDERFTALTGWPGWRVPRERRWRRES